MPLVKGCWQLDNFYNPADNMERGLEDCYFFYYSSCRNGDSCQYRHEPLALGHEMMCSRWLEGRCEDPHCSGRHMIIGKRRDRTPCFWENTPFGCTKPHCVFYHNLPKSSEIVKPVDHQSQRIIAPIQEEEAEYIKSENEDAEMSILAEDIQTVIQETTNIEKSRKLERMPTITISGCDSDEENFNDQDESIEPEIAEQSSGIHSLTEESAFESQLDFSVYSESN